MMNEKDMIERYIYEVTRRVPQEMREDITMELQALIEDMREEEDCSVEEVLKKLGDPAEFAKKYNDSPNYLIGPEYYDNYIWVIKIALFGIAISAVVSAIMQGITGATDLVGFFSNFIAELLNTAINGTYSVVGIVTIIFGVMEWKKVKVSIKPETNWKVDDLTKNVANVKTWTPSSLPPIPDKRAVIDRGESVFSIIFITVFVALLIFAPQLFGAFHYDGGKVTSIASVFNMNEWDRILPLLVVSLLVGMVDEIIRLVSGYYCKVVMYSSIICSGFQLITSVILLKVFPILNPSFAEEIKQATGRTGFSEGDLLRFWGTPGFENAILAIFCAISLSEIVVSIYKTLKYSK